MLTKKKMSPALDNTTESCLNESDRVHDSAAFCAPLYLKGHASCLPCIAYTHFCLVFMLRVTVESQYCQHIQIRSRGGPSTSQDYKQPRPLVPFLIKSNFIALYVRFRFPGPAHRFRAHHGQEPRLDTERSPPLPGQGAREA